MKKSITTTNISGLKLLNRGKVRDIYDLGSELLIVATDRISTFDVVLPTPIPGKGKVLTQMSLFWFKKMQEIIPNHLSKTRLQDIITDTNLYAEIKDQCMIVKKAKPLAVEAIVRGYLSGSGWLEYKKDKQVCGVKLPPNLLESDKLPGPIFTPSTKAEIGLHDMNISFKKMCDIVGTETAKRVRDISIRIYNEAVAYSLSKGIIIADTKFEFGIFNEELILIDEVLTPDSSRFWPASEYKRGGSVPSFDKQYVRDWLIASGWDKNPPAPELPPDIVKKTQGKYEEALKRIVG